MRRVFPIFVLAALLIGCGGDPVQEGDDAEGVKPDGQTATAETSDSPPPAFTVAPSEYPSWTTLLAAARLGLIDGAKGKQGPIEKANNVDIVIKQNDYDTCLQLFGSGAVDAACLTTLDTLPLTLKRPATVVLPTSTSVGGDQIIACGFDSLAALKESGEKIHGLSQSVSQYQFIRSLEEEPDFSPTDFTFEHLPPDAAATALISGNVKAIAVWNPFALTAARKAKDAKVLLTSKNIPNEIIDAIVIGNDSLKRDGADRFCKALCETFYAVCDRINDPATEKETLQLILELGIGSKDLTQGFTEDDMKLILTESQLFATPQDGIKLFQSETLKTLQTEKVLPTLKKMGNLSKTPSIGFDDPSTQLNFSTKFMESAKK